MIYKLIILFFLAFSVWSVSAAERYRWEDAQGDVYYSDRPPPANARNVTRTGVRGETPDSALPYRLQVAVDKFPVTLYVTECGEPCDLARAFLVKRGIPHTMLDPMQPKTREALRTLIGGKLEVPVAQVGKTVLRGFEVDPWNAALDAAGYPSAAMIQVTPTIPAEETVDSPDAQPEDETDADSADTESADADITSANSEDENDDIDNADEE